MPNKTGLVSGVRVRGEQRHYRLFQFNGRNRAWVNDGESVTDAGVRPWEPVIINTVLSSNVVTVTTAQVHLLSVNDKVFITTTADNATYGGVFTVASVPTTTTFTYAKTAGNVATASNGGTCQLVPVVAEGSAGNLTGTYRYFIAPVNRNRQISRGRYVSGVPSRISPEIKVAAKQVTVSGVPATHPDSAVTHWEVYRNQTGNFDSFLEDETQDFWLVGAVAIGTTTFTDNVADKDLPPTAIQFNTQLPPAFSIGFQLDGRMFGARFTPFTDGTATVNSNTCLVDFTSATIPDGFLGATFRKDGDDIEYEITAVVSTTRVALDRPFVGAMSAAAYSIYRNSSELWYSEFDNFEAWGPRSEARRNKVFIGGPGSAEEITAAIAISGRGFVFTRNNIYGVSTSGTQSGDVQVTPTPVVEGIGAVGPDAIWPHRGAVYFIHQSGFYAFDGSNAIPLGRNKISMEFLDALAPAQLTVAAVGVEPSLGIVEFAVPRSGQTENDYVYAFDIETGTFWPVEHVHPRFYFVDQDENGRMSLFYAQGKRIFQAWRGTNDGVPSGTLTGTVTSTTSTSATDGAASFYTTGSGLEECYAHFFNPSTLAHKGSRRLSSNTGTVLTWGSSGAGGGSLTLAAGDVYHIAPVYWFWEGPHRMIPDGMKKAGDLHIRAELQGESTPTALTVFGVVNGVQDSQGKALTINRSSAILSLHRRNVEYAPRIEGRTTDSDLAVRSVLVDVGQPEEEK